MLWPLPVLATVIHGQLLFQVFWTPFSLTKNLLIYLLLPYTWRIPSHFLLLPLAPCLLTLQRFSSSLRISSPASRVPPDAILPQYLLSPPSLSSIACLYFGNWVSWSNASFTGRTHAQNPWLLKVTYEVHGRLGMKLQCFWVTPSHSAQQFPSADLSFRPAALVILHLCRIHFSLETIALCFFLTTFDSEFFGNDFSGFVLAKHPVHLYSAT